MLGSLVLDFDPVAGGTKMTRTLVRQSDRFPAKYIELMIQLMLEHTNTHTDTCVLAGCRGKAY